MATRRRGPRDVGARAMIPTRRHRWIASAAAAVLLGVSACSVAVAQDGSATSNLTPSAGKYPLHTGIVATTFWVGEVYDSNASDGSQVYSTYDSDWMAHYGGCDGVAVTGRCDTEARSARNGFSP